MVSNVAMNNTPRPIRLGIGGLSYCVLVTFVFVVVSVDVFLGVGDVTEPTSFVFCEVLKKDRERFDIGKKLNLARIHNLQGKRFLQSTLRCSRRRARRILYLRTHFRGSC